MKSDDVIVGDISLGAIFVVISYFVLIDLNFNDRDFLMNAEAFSFVLGLHSLSGSIELPGLSTSISIADFFTFIPVLIVLLHLHGLWVLLRGSQEAAVAGAGSEIAAAVTLFTAPAALLVLVWTSAPFANLQPDSGPVGRHGALLVLVLLLALDLLALLAFFPVWSGGARGRLLSSGPLFGTLCRSISIVVSVLCVLAIFRSGQFGGRTIRDWPLDPETAGALRVALIIIAPVLGLAAHGSVRPGWIVGFVRLSRRVIGPVSQISVARALAGPGFPEAARWRLPMHLRVTAAAMALLATSQVASSRAIDVSGQTLAASMPSETLVAAYVTAGQADHETAAFARAIRDHARGIGLDGWQLRGASFADAVMPKVSLRGADLRGAVFDRADLFGADLSRALAAGARFQHVDLAGFPKVADGGIFTGARLNGTDFTGADLRGSIFNKLPDLLPDGAVDPASCGTPPEMLDGAVFTRANLEDATLEGVDFTRLGNIEGAIFKGAKLACAIFDCAMLEAVDFTGADLRAATFKSADVSDAPGAGTSGTCPVPPAPPPVP